MSLANWDNYPGIEVPCACGCGDFVRTPDKRGRPRQFKRGHRVDHSAQIKAAKRRAGFKHSEATRRRLSEAASRPRPWLRGTGNGMSGRTGASNPNWKGGVTPERQALYASAEWRGVVRFVKRRDSHRCVRCGAHQSLHIHHIESFADAPDRRLDPTNLETLCAPCHHEAHRRR